MGQMIQQASRRLCWRIQTGTGGSGFRLIPRPSNHSFFSHGQGLSEFDVQGTGPPARLHEIDLSVQLFKMRLPYALGRPPSQKETEKSLAFLGTGGRQQLLEFCLTLFNTSEFIYVD